MYEGSFFALDNRFIASDMFTAIEIYLARFSQGLIGEFGFTLTDYRVLRRCAVASDAPQVTALAEGLLLPLSTVSTSLNRLDQLGLLERAATQDGRARLVHLTPAGLKAAKLSHDLVRDTLAHLLAPFDPEGRETGAGLAVKNTRNIDTSGFDMTDLHINYISRHKYFITLSSQKQGLCPDDYRILLALSKNPEGLAPSELAWGLLLSPSRISQRLKVLEKKKLVFHEKHPLDRRSRLMKLSPQGSAVQQELTEAYNDLRAADMGEPSPVEVEYYARLTIVVVATARSEIDYPASQS